MVKGNSPELIELYYELYLTWSENRARSRNLPVGAVRWLAQQREPLSKFQAAARGMGTKLQVYLALHEGKPVAAAILIMAGTGAIYWRGASDVRLLDRWPGNDLLQYAMICDACAAGFLSYHMGESGHVESLERFKEQFGAKAHVYAEYVQERLPLISARHGPGQAVSKAIMYLKGGVRKGRGTLKQ